MQWHASYSAYFVGIVAAEVDQRSPGTATLLWTLSIAIANFCVLISAAVFGTIADYRAAKKAFLLVPAISCVLSTALLGAAAPGAVDSAIWKTINIPADTARLKTRNANTS